MIVTDHFVCIHVSRTGGTFLNKLILQYIPGARMIQYHGQLKDLPGELVPKRLVILILSRKE